MLQKKIQGNKLSALLILLTWLVCLAFAGAGAVLAAGIIDTTGSSITIGDSFQKNFQLIIIDFSIFLISIIIAIILSRKLGLSVSGNKSTTNQQVSAIFLSIIGILIGLIARDSTVESPKPSILLPIIFTISALILLYIFASSLVFTSTDSTRKKVWTPVIYFVMLAMPSVILCTFAK